MDTVGKICGYCGESAQETEHVVARRILGPDCHGLTISSCIKCNRAKKPFDEYLADVIGLSIDPEARPDLWWQAGGARRAALNERHMKPAREMLSTYKRIYGPLPTGDWGHVAGDISADGEKICKALEWIVRGLWFYHQKSVLDLEQFESEGIPGPNVPSELARVWPDFDPDNASSIGTAVRYKLTFCDTRPPSGYCLLNLLGAFLFRTRFNESVLMAVADSIVVRNPLKD